MKKLLVCGLGEGFGGVSNVIMSVLRAIPQGTLDITVVETYDSVYHDEILALGNKTVKFPPFKKYFKYKKAAKRYFKNNAFDAVWINNTAKVDLVIMKFAKRGGAKIITHSHGSVQEGSKLKKTVFEILNKLNERKFYSYMDFGIACSKSSADYFYKGKRLKNKRVCVLTNAIDCKKYAFSESKRNAARAVFNADKNDIVLACIGRVCAVKNLSFAVEIVQSLPEKYRLVIIGGGETDALKSRVTDLKLQDRISVLGERNDINDLINGVDILLLPSLSEGLPMVVLEAQANGLKCIISDRVSDECKALESAEFIPSESPVLWAEIILNSDISRNANAIEIMKSKGFDVEAYAKRFLEILNV